MCQCNPPIKTHSHLDCLTGFSGPIETRRHWVLIGPDETLVCEWCCMRFVPLAPGDKHVRVTPDQQKVIEAQRDAAAELLSTGRLVAAEPPKDVWMIPPAGNYARGGPFGFPRRAPAPPIAVPKSFFPPWYPGFPPMPPAPAPIAPPIEIPTAVIVPPPAPKHAPIQIQYSTPSVEELILRTFPPHEPDWTERLTYWFCLHFVLPAAELYGRGIRGWFRERRRRRELRSAAAENPPPAPPPNSYKPGGFIETDN